MRNAIFPTMMTAARHRVASVAVAAAPIGGDFLAEVLENVTRPALRRLAELDHRAELDLIHRPPLLVIGEIGAEIDAGEIVGQPLPLSAAMLAHESVPL